jgi:hypothetical protein
VTKPTPKFIQIVSCGTESNVGVYGLTKDGEVYAWNEKYNERTRTIERGWVKLENE